MQVEYTGRQIEITPAIKTFTESHLRKIRKILGETIEVHVILTVEKYRHTAEVNLKSQTFTINGVEETSDMYNSITVVLDKIERQSLRHKEKFIAKKRKSLTSEAAEALDSESAEDLVGDPRIIKTESFAVKPLTEEEAAEEMVQSPNGFLVFRNSESNKVNVIYKRKDGNFGLVEP
jgi:putative sigma-54 modulation protein